MSKLDLSAPPPNHKFSVSVEREETQEERYVRLFKDVAIFLLAVGFVVAVASLCYATLTSSTATPDEKKWAMSILTAISGGIVGYLVRK
ncbi:MAG: hypothetical protein K2W91_05945 [Novosphingobium sp.]|nr:hypothetical protein [Novosphingobium sp.]